MTIKVLRFASRRHPRKRAVGLFLSILAGTGLALSADSSKLTYFTWAGYTDPAFQKPYTEKYGGGPRVVYFSGTDEAFIRLQAGFQADLAHPCLPDVRKWKDAGLLQPLDPAKIASWNDIFPALRNSSAVNIDGKPWMIPWEWGFSSIIYRTDKVKFTEQTLKVMIDPRYKGKTSFPDVFDEVFQLAAALVGIPKPLDLQEADYPKVENMFRTLRDNARFMWTDPAQIEQAMASGEIVVAWGWTNTAKHLRRQGMPVDFMLEPKEKLATWVCGLAYLKSSTAPRQEVYDFINAVEARESGIAVVDKFGFGHANMEAMKAVPKADLDALGFGGDVNAVLNRGNLMGTMPEAQRKRLIDMWETIKAGG